VASSERATQEAKESPAVMSAGRSKNENEIAQDGVRGGQGSRPRPDRALILEPNGSASQFPGSWLKTGIQARNKKRAWYGCQKDKTTGKLIEVVTAGSLADILKMHASEKPNWEKEITLISWFYIQAAHESGGMATHHKSPPDLEKDPWECYGPFQRKTRQGFFRICVFSVASPFQAGRREFCGQVYNLLHRKYSRFTTTDEIRRQQQSGE
jgi:hypothetical protein